MPEPTKWKDRTEQYKQDLKTIIIEQAYLDLEHKKKMIIHEVVKQIFHMTQGKVVGERTLLTNPLPKQNIAYVTASVLLSVLQQTDDFFKMTFKQEQGSVQ